MHDYEQLGSFYLGRRYDLAAGRPLDGLLLYDAKDLTTHGLCVGMTGSGKTGLCLALLEEAAIDGIPALVIDPKGDLGNLLLAFPELRGADFLPWIDPAEATRQGQTREAYANTLAQRWRDGLAQWGQAPERIRRFRDAADVAIYTPGSTAGLPLTVLRSFAAPAPAVRDNADALRERVASSVSGLLGLLGLDADPLRSREHILLANLLDRAWRAGRDLDLGSLIRAIQEPGLDRVGVIDLESFFPAKDRFGLAMQLNNLLASPGFAAWTEGEPLDIPRLLYTPEGRPRLSILSIAHLGDAERMFFVTILLNELIAWMRSQSGTSSLRALLYMDEVFGYFPPSANPPSKTPMLTLLKQARAFGIGVMMATQNPVDLDYKGLANCGTWFLGRLQTERDKLRVLDGLEGASTAAGRQFDRATMERTLSALGNRVFLMNNVHEDEPVVFQSRWALSYLRGPLTRDQIAALMGPRKAAAAATAPASAAPGPAPTGGAPAEAAAAPSAAAHAEPPPLPGGISDATTARPVLPPDVSEAFLPLARPLAAGERLVYRPALWASARLHFTQATLALDHWDDVRLVAPVAGPPGAEVWAEAEPVPANLALGRQPEPGASFAPLVGELSRAKTYAGLQSALRDMLYRTRELAVWKCAALKQTSAAGESEADFRIRLREAAHEARDLAVEKLRAKYAAKLNTLREQLRKAEQRVETEQAQAQQSTFDAMLSAGTSIVGAMFGRKLASSTNATKAATSMRSAGRAVRARHDVTQAKENVAAVAERLAALEAEFQAEADAVREAGDPARLELVRVAVRPKKTEIAVEPVRLVWTPWRVDAAGIAEPAWAR